MTDAAEQRPAEPEVLREASSWITPLPEDDSIDETIRFSLDEIRL